MDRFEVRVSITKLLLILLVIIVPLSVVGLVLTQRSDRATDDSIGNDFKTIAQLYGNDVSQNMLGLVAAVRALASDPVVISAAAGTAKPAGAGKGGAGLLGSTGSQLLHERRILDPRYLSIVVTNADGDVVAASQQPAKESYAGEVSWQGVYNNGKGAVKISDIVEDEYSKDYYVNIGVPVQEGGTAKGVLSAAVNITDLLARFRQAQISNGARVELVNDDGTIISAPNADVFARVKSSQFDALRDQNVSLQGTQTGWQMANLRSGPYIVGYAATGLKQPFDNLGWVVLVSQAEHQAAAPIRQLEHFALLMVILALFMLTLLCVYYFIHRTQKFEDIEGVLPADRGRATAASR
ncbi:MAG: cache domain-containing protein [Acidobacteriaceae bacterium]|nr:cache domain-containing protein [Acidobacteriaceae bacterium]MBV9294802.1 cache domain-containing protein [Acidobacteriaceae bacterium]MBV9766194.1 cache domain-containing protein [Acidobacteriaceae bacterium]